MSTAKGAGIWRWSGEMIYLSPNTSRHVAAEQWSGLLSFSPRTDHEGTLHNLLPVEFEHSCFPPSFRPSSKGDVEFID